MRSLHRSALTAFAATIVVATAAHAQSIGGRVVDDATGAGLDGVELSAVAATGGDTLRAATDADGRFLLRLPFGVTGRYTVAATRIGYRPLESSIDVEGTEHADIVIRLSVSAVAIDALTVTARGIEDRHRASWEGFVVRRANRPDVGSVLIMDRSDNVFRTAFDVGRVLQWLPPASRRGRCVRVLMDGFESPAWTLASVEDMSPELLEGVEFYVRPLDAPLEYRDGTPCSVLALWRRSPRHRVPPQLR